MTLGGRPAFMNRVFPEKHFFNTVTLRKLSFSQRDVRDRNDAAQCAVSADPFRNHYHLAFEEQREYGHVSG